MTAAATLRAMGACPKALEWAETHGGTLAALWRDCPRGDWLLWYAARTDARQEDLVRAAAGCAELALPCAGDARDACEAAIAAARTWADAPGEETRRAAADAADAANAAHRAAHRAADRAAYAAADAAAYAAADAEARDEMHRRCADVVRACVPFVEVVR